MKPRGFLFVLLLASLSPGMVGNGWADGQAKRGRPILVEAAEARLQPAAIELERPGTLKYRRILRVYNREEGLLKHFPWFEGDLVEKGERLLELDARKLDSEIRKAQAELKLNERRVARLEKLMERNAASSDELAEARTELEVARAELELLRTRLSYTRVTAPFTGIVTERLAEPGDVKPRYEHLLTLADPASLVVGFEIDAEVLGEIEAGDPVRIRLAGSEHPATIQRIFPTVDPVSRLGKVEAAFDELPIQARAGQFVRVTLTTRPRDRLLIPFSALRRDREGEHVYRIE
ncbi:MAG TPA: efflux RND transporter periplasmic adaptor subunit, partial [Chromatiaceae bacterium]|nr:efflux RND transporter periplasmic adaptor subunit [Chromatiaceae bacterium]